MKKSIKIFVFATLTLTFSLSPFTTLRAQVKWHTIEEASEAKIGTRLYMVDFYTDWCGYCKKMDRETFSDVTVAKILNSYYYPVKFNAEGRQPVTWRGRTFRAGNDRRRSVHEFALSTLGSRMGFPTVAIFRADGTLVNTIPGFYPAKDFAMFLWYFASGDCDRYPFERYTRIFDKEIRPQMVKALGQ